jgi:hypothetical protein
MVDVYMRITADIKQQIPLIPVLCRFLNAKSIIEDFICWEYIIMDGELFNKGSRGV